MKSDFLVYLAGPISGLSYDQAEGWRKIAKDSLAEAGIKAVSPLRGKDYLRKIGAISAHARDYADLNCLSTPRGIMTRDRFDATRCNALLVNLLGAKIVGIGTTMEIAWADLCRIPVVCVMEATGNIHDHAMLNEAIGYRVDTLEEAIHVIKLIADNS